MVQAWCSIPVVNRYVNTYGHKHLNLKDRRSRWRWVAFLDLNKVDRKGGYHNAASEKQGGDMEGRLGNSVWNNIRGLLQLYFYISATEPQRVSTEMG